MTRRIRRATARRHGPLPLGVLLMAAVGCGPALASAPPASAPAPAPVPAAPTPVAASPRATRFTLPAASGPTTYTVRVRTALQRDSAGMSEQGDLESSARIALTLRRDPRGGLRGTGRVDSFTVRASGASAYTTTAPSAPPVTAPPLGSVNVDVLLDSAFVRASVRPALANECDRPEAAAASMARDLLVRVPTSVAVGERWRDSLVAFVCRGGVPITMRTVTETFVERSDDGDRRLQLRRTLTTRLEGVLRSPWRQVELAGEGVGGQTITLDIARGTIVELDGESTLTFRMANGSLRDASRVQRVVQRATVQVRAVR